MIRARCSAEVDETGSRGATAPAADAQSGERVRKRRAERAERRKAVAERAAAEAAAHDPLEKIGDKRSVDECYKLMKSLGTLVVKSI